MNYGQDDAVGIGAETALAFCAGVMIGGAVLRDDYTGFDVSFFIKAACGEKAGLVMTSLKGLLQVNAHQLGLNTDAAQRLFEKASHIQ